MKKYALYLESGPRQRKTMVHVLDLLGCIAQGPTTSEALEATTEAIQEYLRFLQRHGEVVEPEDPFTTVIAEHIMEGDWLGNGDPTPGFAPDFQKLTNEDLKTYLRHLDWMQADLKQQISHLPQGAMLAEPLDGSRSIYHILEHVAESQSVYLRYLVGKVDGLSAAQRAVQQGAEDLPDALTKLWNISRSRLEMMTEAERGLFVKHGKVTWTARRAMRRMLEHTWEHLLEVKRRLEGR